MKEEYKGYVISSYWIDVRADQGDIKQERYSVLKRPDIAAHWNPTLREGLVSKDDAKAFIDGLPPAS